MKTCSCSAATRRLPDVRLCRTLVLGLALSAVTVVSAETIVQPVVASGKTATDIYYLNDHLATTMAKVDAAGIIAQMESNAFGGSVFDGNTEISRYGGKPYDNDMGTYISPYRNLIPNQAKWLTNDPSGFPNGRNNYQHANNPLIYVDKTGLELAPFDASGYRHSANSFQMYEGANIGNEDTPFLSNVNSATYSNNAILQTVDFDLLNSTRSGYIVQQTTVWGRYSNDNGSTWTNDASIYFTGLEAWKVVGPGQALVAGGTNSSAYSVIESTVAVDPTDNFYYGLSNLSSYYTNAYSTVSNAAAATFVHEVLIVGVSQFFPESMFNGTIASPFTWGTSGFLTASNGLLDSGYVPSVGGSTSWFDAALEANSYNNWGLMASHGLRMRTKDYYGDSGLTNWDNIGYE
jgi:RHS repeat-associated protein